jgi:hypothetical protein
MVNHPEIYLMDFSAFASKSFKNSLLFCLACAHGTSRELLSRISEKLMLRVFGQPLSALSHFG